MLSYQHAYHAGNLADVHKHALMCCILDYMLQKDKPLSYIETHAGRGLYDLESVESEKTGEAATGIIKLKADGTIPSDHPYSKVLKRIEQENGPNAYPGSPLIAETMLRWDDRVHLCEMHPQEHAALRQTLKRKKAKIYHEDGFKITKSLVPPEPRRGVMLIDPSYELKEEYVETAEFAVSMHRKWPVGTIAIWYPILEAKAHYPMLYALDKENLPKTFKHEVMFGDKTPDEHGLLGSGMFFINTPYGLEEKATEIEAFFK